MASVPVRPIPAPQWIKTRFPSVNRLAVREASDQKASRSSGTPQSGTGKRSTGHGNVFVASASAYAGDFLRISSGGARQMMMSMPTSRIFAQTSARGS